MRNKRQALLAIVVPNLILLPRHFQLKHRKESNEFLGWNLSTGERGKTLTDLSQGWPLFRSRKNSVQINIRIAKLGVDHVDW